MKRSFAEILKEEGAAAARKAAAKMPQWALTEGMEYPGSLCLEQCSGTATALYKASLLASRGPLGGIADLTGGLGVDSWAFAGKFERVLYFERNSDLAGAAGRNFARLGVDNICVRAQAFDLEQTKEFAPDWIYLDPARRSAAGRKVFLLEDCEPDVLALMPELRAITPRLMLKLSPMADITMLRRRLGAPLREIHIVCTGGEVKELLCILGDENPGPAALTLCSDGALLDIDEAACEGAGYVLPKAGEVLLEPCAGLLKSGAFDLPRRRWGLGKLDRFTHLYVTGGTPGESLLPFFKLFEILEVLPLGKAEIAAAGRKYPRAEVSARGIPMSSEELRSRLGAKTGSDIHIFGCTACASRLLLVCRKSLDTRD